MGKRKNQKPMKSGVDKLSTDAADSEDEGGGKNFDGKLESILDYEIDKPNADKQQGARNQGKNTKGKKKKQELELLESDDEEQDVHGLDGSSNLEDKSYEITREITRMPSRSPPDECALFNSFLQLRRSDSLKQGPPLYTELIRGLRSQMYRQEFYSAYVTILKMDQKVEVPEILKLINGALTTDADSTKGEKKIICAARILALGGLVRSGQLKEEDVNTIFQELALHCERKGSLSTLASSFILPLLDILAVNKSIPLAPLQHLLDSTKNTSRLQIILKARELDLKLNYTLWDSVADSVFVLNVLEDDNECLDSLFSYILFSESSEVFWSTLTEKIRKRDLGIFCACIAAAVRRQCPLQHMLTRKTIVFLLETFRRQDPADHAKAKNAITLLLNWNPESVKMKKSERNTALTAMFEGVPNLLHEYKFLNTALQHFLTFLSRKELEEVSKMCIALLNTGERLGISTLNYLCRIALTKTTNLSTKMNIMMTLFTSGYCESERDEVTTRSARVAFVKILGVTIDAETINELFQKIHQIITDKGEVKFKETLKKEVLKKLDKISKMEQDDSLVSIYLKLHSILLVIEPSRSLDTVNELLAISKVKDDEKNTKLAELILTLLFQADEDTVLNYNDALKILLHDSSILADNISVVAAVLDPDNISVDQKEDDDESESEADVGSDDEDGEEAIQEKNTIIKENDQDEDSDSSIDMDEASAEDINRMDKALAGVFSAKKKANEQEQAESKIFMRACQILELALKTSRVLPATFPVLVLMPCISCLVKCSKTKNSQLLARISRVMKRLNSIKELGQKENVDEEIIVGLTEDITELLKKKCAKNVRKLMEGSLKMLSRCFAEKKVKPSENKQKRRSNGMQKQVKRRKIETA